MEREHETTVVVLNNIIAEELNNLVLISDKNVKHVEIIQEAVLKLIDYAMDEAVAKDHR